MKMIFIFVIDTSGSMNQKFSGGLSFIDCAKNGVEHFVKMRQRQQSNIQLNNPTLRDILMLVTFEEGQTPVKVGWKDSFVTFSEELKLVQANTMSNFGYAIRSALDLANMYRLQTNVDNYYQVSSSLFFSLFHFFFFFSFFFFSFLFFINLVCKQGWCIKDIMEQIVIITFSDGGQVNSSVGVYDKVIRT